MFQLRHTIRLILEEHIVLIFTYITLMLARGIFLGRTRKTVGRHQFAAGVAQVVVGVGVAMVAGAVAV